jgi:hypothetical protein
MLKRLATLLALLLVALPWLGCHRDSDALAWLEQKQGAVDRDFAGRVGNWEIAQPKAAFRVGDGVRTGADSTARLELSDKSKLSLEAKTLVRFLARPPGQSSQRMDVETGEAVIEVGSESLRLDTVIGSAILDPFTSARLSHTDNGLRFAVAIGAARIDAEGQPPVPVAKGETREFIVPGKAPPSPPSVDSAGPLEASSTAPTASAAPAIDMTGVTHGPDIFDFEASAGDSMVVHDPHPPTIVGLAKPDSCAGQFVVEVAGGRTPRRIAGEKTANLELSAGAHPYGVRCAKDDGTFDKPTARGTLTILADSGTRRLPTSAPSTLVDTDGRKYTVLYQNLLPSITLRWTGAPSGAAFTVHESSPHGSHAFSAGGPTFTFAPGSLGEGSHDLSFESAGKLSKVTTVTIRFDNAAPTASIFSPPASGFVPGGTISVTGTAMPGWGVSVGGNELSQDDQHRFAGQIAAPSGQRALLIRFTNPQRGVQYYLRRASH